MPDGWAASAGGFPAMTGNIPFLMKGVVLLAVSIYLLKQDVVRVTASAGNREMPLEGLSRLPTHEMTMPPNQSGMALIVLTCYVDRVHPVHRAIQMGKPTAAAVRDSQTDSALQMVLWHCSRSPP
jgi:hypothetical protein